MVDCIRVYGYSTLVFNVLECTGTHWYSSLVLYVVLWSAYTQLRITVHIQLHALSTKTHILTHPSLHTHTYALTNYAHNLNHGSHTTHTQYGLLTAYQMVNHWPGIRELGNKRFLQVCFKSMVY